MDNQLFLALKQKIEDIGRYGEIDAEIKRNVLKEELQYYVLNFIYHHPEYSQWTMYGGSALRICHDLNRMSVDLDFEINHACTEKFLEDLKTDIEKYFTSTYELAAENLTIKINHGRGLVLRFVMSEGFDIGHTSKQVHVKIDLNHFEADKTVIQRIPINHGQLSFVIKTYNMSALMASKIAAIFLRGERGVGKTVYEEKGRDIYDLLWYMDKKIVPDLDYLREKNVEEAKNLRVLFDKLTIKMNNVSKENLAQDLLPLFLERGFIEIWLAHWLQNYIRLEKTYNIRTPKKLMEVSVFEDFRTDVFYFTYTYETEEGGTVRIQYKLSDYWIDFGEGNLNIPVADNMNELIKFGASGWSSRPTPQEKLKQYAMLFYQKTEEYLKKTNRVILGDVILTKTIRMTADNLNQKEQIVLNKSALISCELEDLLK